MSPPDQGRESPDPTTQSGRQQKDTPASGKGADKINVGEKKKELQEQLDKLESNPKGPLDDALDAKFSKTTKPGE